MPIFVTFKLDPMFSNQLYIIILIMISSKPKYTDPEGNIFKVFNMAN
jgi:hypothetical protein